ncbi:MAG: S8 family serine peptidase [Oscillochloridaceae bacterium umkhey_bin13]
MNKYAHQLINQRSPRLGLILLMLLSLLLIPSPVRAQGDGLTGELIVALAPGIELTADGRSSDPLLDRQFRQLGVHSARPLAAGSSTYLLQIKAQHDPALAASRLHGSPGIMYAEPNLRQQVWRTPNDPGLADQWPLRQIRAAEAWEITTGEPIIIAVLDTGVDERHPDLANKLLPGYNSLLGRPGALDDNGHGTAVAGQIAAQSDNAMGIAGICWGCTILPIKVLDYRGIGSTFSVAQGLRWAADNGARVINLSLGGSRPSQTLREAVQYATERGILVVAAVGNEAELGNAPSYPAAYPEVLAVGGVGPDDQVASFSNTGNYLGLSAPASSGLTTVPGGNYAPTTGTSFASPWVAGAAGLLLSLRPDLDWFDLACILQASADDLGSPGRDATYGYGRLNLVQALTLAQSYQGCPLNEAATAPGRERQPLPAFAPVAPSEDPAVRFFPETGHTLRGEFRNYWERQGGLAIFGFPISEELLETGSDGQVYTVQYFERHRLEFHPANAEPYRVLLSRIGDELLKTSGRDWFTFPRNRPSNNCRIFPETGHSVCDLFLRTWRSSGLELDGRPGISEAESMALFGLPLSPAQSEEVAPGVWVTVQWFERARLEDHGEAGILRGLLGNELVDRLGLR